MGIISNKSIQVPICSVWWCCSLHCYFQHDESAIHTTRKNVNWPPIYCDLAVLNFLWVFWKIKYFYNNNAVCVGAYKGARIFIFYILLLRIIFYKFKKYLKIWIFRKTIKQNQIRLNVRYSLPSYQIIY